MSIIDERLKQIVELEERMEKKKMEIEGKRIFVEEQRTAIEARKTWIEEKREELEKQNTIVNSVPDDLLSIMSQSASRSTERRGRGDTIEIDESVTGAKAIIDDLDEAIENAKGELEGLEEDFNKYEGELETLEPDLKENWRRRMV